MIHISTMLILTANLVYDNKQREKKLLGSWQVITTAIDWLIATWPTKTGNNYIFAVLEPNNLSLLRSYRKEDSCCFDTWSEWMSQPMPGEFWLQFPRVIGEGQLDDPTPPGWPLWRTTYLCTTSPIEDAIEMALDKPLLLIIGSKRSYALMVHAE